MKTLHMLVMAIFLLCLLCCNSFVAEGADRGVSFEVTQVELSGSKVLLHGNFKNESEELTIPFRMLMVIRCWWVAAGAVIWIFPWAVTGFPIR